MPEASSPPESDAGVESPRRVHLLGMDIAALRKWLALHDEPRYRSDQLVEWIYARRATSFDEMTVLPKRLRTWLAEHAALHTSAAVRESVASDQTTKLLLEWPDGNAVETVWIPAGQLNTACLSSQVGCPVGCKFCASGIDGVERDLTAGEIVEQALRVSRLISASGDVSADERPPRLSNIVMMGMGEPLANYAEVIKAIRILNAPWGLNIGARKITVSTVGIPQQIRRLASEDLQLNLALSLHAPDEELRKQLIPWGKIPLHEVLDACRYYFDETGREITLEYVLLAGVNDRPRHALGLAKIAKRLRANVNLLRYNPVAGLRYERPSSEDTAAFQKLLRDRNVNVHVRRSRGRDIAAACGQLRRSTKAATDREPPT